MAHEVVNFILSIQAFNSYGGKHDGLYRLFMHEIIHALGFSNELFDKYVSTKIFQILLVSDLLLACYVCRFVDVNGTQYNPVRTYNNGPYGKTTIFTGPKVGIWLWAIFNYMGSYVW